MDRFNSIFIFFFPGILALAFYGYEYAALVWKIKENELEQSSANTNLYGKIFNTIIRNIINHTRVSVRFAEQLFALEQDIASKEHLQSEETEKVLMRTSQKGR